MTETRKLAAILAADVVGFSRLAGADEDRTLARLRTLRSDLIDPTIEVHRGRVVKRTGDGLLVEFRSVVDAVRCAIEIQNGMNERNAGVAPERRIEFRCGIHLGDVVEESDGDLMGDGVNIAARLEGIAKPGSITLSEDAYRQVKSRLDLAVSDLGNKDLKNIAEPVRVYSLDVGKVAQRKPPAGKGSRSLVLPLAAACAVVVLAVAAGGAWYFLQKDRGHATGEMMQMPMSAARLSVVVLPFMNLSGDPAQDYFAEGVTENLTTALSRIRGSFVIARSTAAALKGKAVDAGVLGKMLGVRYVLEGSVQRSGQNVRVNARLIGTDQGEQLWADSFDAQVSDLFKLEDDIVAHLSRALQIELVQAEGRRSVAEMRRDPDATDLAMQGWSIMYRTPTMQNNQEARLLFERAAAIDPKLSDAVAGLAYVDSRDHFNGWFEAGDDKGKRALEETEQTIALDPNYALVYYIKANLLAYSMKPNDEQRGAEALDAAETALRLNPSLAFAHYVVGTINTNLGHYDRAIEHIQQAIRLSPRDYLLGPWLMHLGRAHFGLHQYATAVQDELRSLDTGYHTFQPYLALAAAYAANGEDDKAKKAMSDALKANTNVSVVWLQSHLPALIDAPPGLREAAQKAGLPEK
jgi:class 3 adenylate cyclase/TolB-like protein/Tfp pilus assembly protein PilF